MPPGSPQKGNLRGGLYMKDWRSLAHTKWDCKYHMVLIAKYRHKVFFAKSRKRVGEILRELCRYKGIELLEGNAQPDHIHMCVSIPPKYSVAMIIGYLKGKSGAPRGASVAGSESLLKENSASCILDRVLGLQR